MFPKNLFLVILLTIVGLLQAAPSKPEWQIIKTHYPTADVVVAGYNVVDFGAKGDGRSDCTKAFQLALNKMDEAGGGTVFVPEGKYAFKGSLQIPSSVTLRGEWREPTADDPGVHGTILMPFGGKGKADGVPFITVDFSAGIKDLNIWYPDQSAGKPEPYPFCLIQKGGDNATFENLTLVNPYQGIRIGPGGNELHLVRNVYGTPLRVGIQYDSTTDIGRLEKIRFSPRWWSQSGLPQAPATIEWLKTNGTAIHMLRSDWEYVADVEIDGYARGYLISEGVRGAANAQFYRLNIRDCTIAMEVEKTNPFGMVFTECNFDGTQYGVLVGEKFDSAALFSSCVFGGQAAFRCNGRGNVLMEQCRIERGHVLLENGAHSILGCTLNNAASLIHVGKTAIGVSLSGNQFSGDKSPVRSEAPKGIVQTLEAVPPLKPIPAYPKSSGARNFIPLRIALTVITASGRDDTNVIQKAMDEQALKGGGIVFLPGGDYQIKGNLKVPTGVLMRGIHDVPHHTSGAGSVLHIYPQNETPTIIMESGSCLSGLGFNYPEQSIEKVKPYPFLIQGHGSNISVINVNAANPARFIDFMTYRCDDHFIEYASGAPLMTGIAVGGGSRNGVVQNTQFNPHYWSRSPRADSLYANKPGGGIQNGTGKMLWEYQKENLDALVIGSSENQFLYQNFVFGSLYGIHFTGQDGHGAINCLSHGHGTDGSKVSCYLEYGQGEINMVNTELVAMSSQNKTAIKLSDNFTAQATFINTMVWGSPDLLADIKNGTLTLQNLHANRQGKGGKISKGTLNAFNFSLTQPGGFQLEAARGSEVFTTGFITRGSLQTSGGGKIKKQGNISR